MTESLVVILGDVIAGAIERLRGGELRFEYDSRYRAARGSTPLSLSMPLELGTHTDGVVTPWLWGLLPENERVLSRWAREFRATASSPFSLLATPVGHDCAGAVRFASPDEVDVLLKQRGRVRWLTAEDVARRLRELKQDATAWLGPSFEGQFSLAGAQAKTALLYRRGRWGVPAGATPTSHILKPAVAGLDDHDLNEHICMEAARRVGLVVARTRVLQFASETAIVVDRYDRLPGPQGLGRIHQEDLCQALSLLPAKKYQSDGGPGPIDVVALFRRVMPPSVADESIWQFVDALAWNWVIGGTDAHAKNYSLLLDASEVRLAPLYDVASVLPYGTNERKLRFAMKIGHDYSVYPRRNPWPVVAAALAVDEDRLLERVRHLAANAGEALSDIARTPAVRKLRRALPTKLVDLISERATRCLALTAAVPERA